jgi:hypothetical protein
VKVVCKAEHGHGHGNCRLLTGSILAHELMHAWLRLKGTDWLLAPSISTLMQFELVSSQCCPSLSVTNTCVLPKLSLVTGTFITSIRDGHRDGPQLDFQMRYMDQCIVGHEEYAKT